MRENIIYRSAVEFSTSAEIRKNCNQKKLFGLGVGDKEKLRVKLKELDKKGITPITFVDKNYPKELLETSDFPAVLYCRGNIGLLRGESLVAMVGSRRATSYGLSVAKRFASKIAAAGATIVSGMALGIDAQCHRGALSVSGKTIAVLGTPIDDLYPRENESLGQKIVKDGLVVSEYPPGFTTYKTNFPMRNRIIAGLSKATVVIEAAESSGALITAMLALDSNRDLYAVPGDVDKISSRGTNTLLSKGAICLHDPLVIIEDLGLSNTPIMVKLPKTEQAIIDLIRAGVDSFDRIIKKMEISPEELGILISRLEIKGVAKRSGGKIKVFD